MIPYFIKAENEVKWVEAQLITLSLVPLYLRPF